MANRRILLIDDNPAIHADFRKVLAVESDDAGGLSAAEAAFFGSAPAQGAGRPAFEIDSAMQGVEGVARVRSALQDERPYAMAFVDMRMPPGWDGLETVSKIWQEDPHVQIVICTAYSDYSWEQILAKLGHSDRLVILKKPFDSTEVLQLANGLTQKWQLARQTEHRLKLLEQSLEQRTRDMHAISAQLAAANRREDEAGAHVRRRRSQDNALRRALRAQEFFIDYQPLVDIASRRAVGLEALLRWRHPKLGTIPPARFIPAAEESGLIVPLGEFVLRAVCEQMMRWQREGIALIPVAVNISAVQIHDGTLCELIRRILRETAMSPQLLSLEITEGTLMKDPQHHAALLQSLRGDGIRVQIDDFGTGYSSLSYLRHLPIDTLKIDSSFVHQIDSSATAEAIVGAILGMARSLGLRAVAEGVETPAQLHVLGKHGCETAQGYFFSVPLSVERTRDLLVNLARRESFTDTLRLQLAGTGR